MIDPRVIVLLLVVILYGGTRAGAEKIDGDAKVRLLNLLSPSDLAKVIEDPSLDSSKNLINPRNHALYGNKDKFYYDYDEDDESQDTYSKGGKNAKFAIPWLNFGNNDRRAISEEAEKVSDKQWDRYEVKEEHPEDYNFPPYSHRNHQHVPQFDLGYYNGFKHNHGSYQGHSLLYHHNHDYQPHQHTLNCFPFGNRRRRPRPPPPPPPPTAAPTSAAPPSIDPRVSTLAGFVGTEAPRIDIRVGRGVRDRIVFPE